LAFNFIEVTHEEILLGPLARQLSGKRDVIGTPRYFFQKDSQEKWRRQIAQ
jgi:hypothetical protein